MDGIIGLLVMWFIFSLIGKGANKGKKAVKKLGDVLRDNMGDDIGDLIRQFTDEKPHPKTNAPAPLPEPAPEMEMHTAYVPVHEPQLIAQSGSMTDFVSQEGYDPCHDDYVPAWEQSSREESAMTDMSVIYAVGQPQNRAIGSASSVLPEFNRESLVRSVVMSEILTRPSQRKRGRMA